MKCRERIWLGALAVSLGISFFSVSLAAESESSSHLVWKANRTAEAHIENLPLGKVLSKLAAASGWKILVQPGLEQRVTARFKNIPQGEALKMLLGGLSYALVPQLGGGSRLYVYESNLNDATKLVQPDADGRPKNWLANEIILSLKPGSKEDVDKLAAELGGKVVAKSEELNAYRIEFPNAETAEAARQTVANREDLAFQDNYSYDRPEVTTAASPSLESMFPMDPKPVSTGDQVLVALVDTPVQPLDGKWNDYLLPSVHLRGDVSIDSSDPTHGTSMAYVLLSAANDGRVKLLPIDIYGDSKSTTTLELAQGIYKGIQAKARIINVSSGGEGQNPMIDYLVQKAAEQDILVVAAAGNSPLDIETQPAANPNALAVTSVNRNGEIASFANRSSFVDVKAPASLPVFFNGRPFISTGTSASTAYMSGQGAWLAAQGHNFRQMNSVLRSTFDVNAPPPARRNGQ